MATASNNNCISTLSWFVNCELCLEMYQKPKALTCLHGFCEDCLKDYAKLNATHENNLPCPQCRKLSILPPEGVSGLPDHQIYLTIQEALKAFDPSDVSIDLPQEETILEQCDIHGGQGLTWFCRDCLEQICTCCLVSEHQGHCNVGIETEVAATKITLVEWNTKLNDKCQEILNMLKKIKLDKEMKIEKVKRAQENIEKRYQQLFNQLVQERDKLNEKIEKYKASLENETKTFQDKSGQILVDVHKSKEAITEMEMHPSNHFILNGVMKIQPGVDALLKLAVKEPEEKQQFIFQKSMTKNIDNVIGNYLGRIEVVVKDADRPVPEKCTLARTIHCDSDGVVDVAFCEFGDIVSVTSAEPGEVQIHTQSSRLAFRKRFCSEEGADKLSWPKGIVTLPCGNIAITDHSSKEIKIYDKSGNLLNSTSCGGKHPFAIDVLGSGDIAVSYCLDKLVLIHSRSSLDDSWQAINAYDSIHSVNFNSSFGDSVSVKQRPRTWYITGAITNSSDHRMNLQYPRYLSSWLNDGLVISDIQSHSVFALKQNATTREFEFQWRFGASMAEDGKSLLKTPHGICTNSHGNVLIADRGHKRIILLSKDGEFLRVLLSRYDGIKNPWSLALSGDESLLLVGQGKGKGKSLLKVYKCR